jgi:hypothetical protein
MYATVPMAVPALVSAATVSAAGCSSASRTSLAKPKSSTLQTPSAVRKTLAGFKSR